jgi:hypothetical protein
MPKEKAVKRFTVWLESADYAELRRIAGLHRPPLSNQYLVRYALLQFLDANKGKKPRLDLN